MPKGDKDLSNWRNRRQSTNVVDQRNQFSDEHRPADYTDPPMGVWDDDIIQHANLQYELTQKIRDQQSGKSREERLNDSANSFFNKLKESPALLHDEAPAPRANPRRKK